MASSYTSNYNLNQWKGTDKVLRAEFNEDNVKVDAALTGLAEQVAAKVSQTDLNSLAATVALKGNCQIEIGSYVGTGSASSSLTFTTRPLMVIVMGKYTTIFNGYVDSGYSTPPSSSSFINRFSWTENTLTWSHENNSVVLQLNEQGVTYRYIAVFNAAD